jgi:hypothetical protein
MMMQTVIGQDLARAGVAAPALPSPGGGHG